MRRMIVLSISLLLALLWLAGALPSGLAIAQEYGEGYEGFYAGRFSLTFSPGVLFGDAIYEGRVAGNIDIKYEVDDAFLYLFRGEYAFTDNIALEVNIGGSTNDAEAHSRNLLATSLGLGPSSTDSFTFDGNQLLLHANVLYQYPVQSFVPFVTVGVGMVKWSLDVESATSRVGPTTWTLSDLLAAGLSRDEVEYDESDVDVNFGGGIKYHITDNAAVRVDVRDHVVFPQDSPFFGEAETLHMLEFSGGISYVW